MARDSEVEFKLAIDPADAAAFRRLPLLHDCGLGRPHRLKVYNVYFDTPGLLLKRHSMALRLRRIDGKWLQTLKTAGVNTGGLHQRGEWEYPLRTPQLDLALFRETPLARLAQGSALHLALKPVFTSEFHRTSWLLEMAPGQRVDVALDRGVICCGELAELISEVEIELLDGSAAAVFDVAFALVLQLAMRPAHVSKAARGYRLFHPEPLVSRRAGTIELEREWSRPEAFEAIVAACLGHYDANVEGALGENDPEFIHQLRVALRRLRSAMRIFRPSGCERAAAELKWLTAALGDARDWDVLIVQTLPVLLLEFGDTDLASDLMEAATRRQRAARDAARAALVCKRQSLLLMTIGRWAGVPGEVILLPSRETCSGDAAQASTGRRLSRFAMHELRRRRRRLLRVKGGIANLSADERHQVRIAAKRFRYAVDFFSSLFDQEHSAPYAKVLGELQDLLGETNDDAVAMRLVESLAPPRRFMDFAERWLTARTRARFANIDRQIDLLGKFRQFRMH
jgi:inorganic triphosphatase YgiF